MKLVDERAQRLVAAGNLAVAPDGPFETRLMMLCADHPDDLPILFRTELHKREFFPLLCDARLLELVASLMPEAESVRIYPNYSCRAKSPSPKHEVVWHQDAGLTGDGKPATSPAAERLDAFGLGRVVNVWSPLVPVRVANGAMKFIPRSHRLGILPHVLDSVLGTAAHGQSGAGKRTAYNTTVESEALKTARPEAAVDVECEPGDVVLFSNLLVHRGGANTSDTIRWSFDWRFQDAAK